MRNISGALLAKIATRIGTEPILVVGVKWGGTNEVFYADKKLSNDVLGKVLEIANIEDVSKISGSGSTGSVSVKLDDTDGTIKTIINTTNVHKKPVTIYQSFIGVSDRFPIYEGQINTPIVWNEGDQTVTFEVVTIVEDREVGFSAEEGQFLNLPQDAVGQVWPLVFGDARRTPGLTFQKVPIGTTYENFLVQDRIGFRVTVPQLDTNIQELGKFLQFLFITQAEAHFNEDFDIEEQIRQQTIQVQEQINAMQAAVRQFAEEARIARLTYDTNIANELKQISTNFIGHTVVPPPPPRTDGVTLLNRARYFPQGKEIFARVGDFVVKGKVTGDQFIFEVQRPPIPVQTSYVDTNGQAVLEYLKPAWSDSDIFVTPGNVIAPSFTGTAGKGPHGEVIPVGWSLVDKLEPEGISLIPAGSTVQIIGDVDIDFIVNIVPTTVNRVWAYKSVGSLRQIAVVPSAYWKQVETSYGIVTAQVVRLKRPLSGYAFENWEDEIFVDQTSSVGPNLADILIWLIEKYTLHGYDATSFNEVRTQLANYPCNFYLDKRENILSVLGEMAYQARCSIWLKNGTFFIQYLPLEKSSVDTITEDDIEVGSLTVTCTGTEELVTKLKVGFRSDYAIDKNITFIVRNNIDKYGIVLQDETYYIYTDPELVQKSVTFWIIRKSNTWKRVTFKTFLTKLKLETYDTVTLDFNKPYVADGPVKALVESAVYDSSDNTIEMTCWVAVRLGEMTQYALAWPAGASATLVFPDILRTFDAPQKPAFFAGEIGGQIPLVLGGGFQTTVENPENESKNKKRTRTSQGEPFPSDADDDLPFLLPDTQDLDPSPARVASPHIDYTSIIPDFTNPQQDAAGTSSSFPGKVIGKTAGGTLYTVDVYKNGLAADPTTINKVKQLQLADDSSIPNGTWVLVSQVRAKTGTSYYMQAPVWLA